MKRKKRPLRKRFESEKRFDLAYIGCDPGASGCIAVITPQRDLHCFRLAKEAVEIGQVIITVENSFRDQGYELTALVEQVSAGGASTGGGKGSMGATSAFSFGGSYYAIRASLFCMGIPQDRVTPVKWQKEFGLRKGSGESNTAKKNRHKAKASELFPNQDIFHWNADGILIAEYLRRVKEGELK